jgi:hypothetical protein
MKSIKNMPCLLLLCIINIIEAKRTKATQVPVTRPTQPQPTPTKQPQPIPIIPKALTYTEILTILKEKKPNSSDFQTLQNIIYEAKKQMEAITKTVSQTSGKPITKELTQQQIASESQKKEEALMALNSADQRLDAIKKDALGSAFAQKAKEICDADYTQAEKLGKINLCSELKRNLVAPVYRIDERAQQKGINPDLAPAIEDIKNSINRLHSALGRYKLRGEAS